MAIPPEHTPEKIGNSESPRPRMDAKQRAARRAAELSALQAERRADYRALVERSGRPWATYVFLAILVGVHLLARLSDADVDVFAMLTWGIDHPSLIARGEVWRILSSGFVHFETFHLLANGLFFWIVARLAERFYGHFALVLLFFLCHMGGMSLTHLLESGGGWGASAAIYGICAATMTYVLVQRRSIPSAVLKRLLVWLSALIVLLAVDDAWGWITGSEVNKTAHLGGFLTGAVLGGLLSRPATAVGPFDLAWYRRAALATLVMLGITAVGIVVVSNDPKTTAEWHVIRGVDYAGTKDWESARREFTRAIAIDPDNARAFGRRGYVRLRTDDLPGALGDCTRAIEIDPELWTSFFYRGCVRIELEDHQGAEADLTRAIKLRPELALAFGQRALARAELGELEEAIKDYSRAIRREPDTAFFHVGRAWLHSESENWEEVIRDCTNALQIDPTMAIVGDLFGLRGQAHARCGDLEAARTDFTKAIERDSEDAGHFRSRGDVREDLGDLEGALSDWERAIGLDPLLANELEEVMREVRSRAALSGSHGN